MESVDLIYTIIIISVILLIYDIISEYNKGGFSRAIILDTIFYSIAIVVCPFYLLYFYTVKLLNGVFYQTNNIDDDNNDNNDNNNMQKKNKINKNKLNKKIRIKKNIVNKSNLNF